MRPVVELEVSFALREMHFSAEHHRRSCFHIAVKPHNSADDRPKRGGNLDVFGIGNETLALVRVGVNLGGECRLDLRSIAAENNKSPALRNFVDGQTLALQPLLDLCCVGIRHAKLLPVLRGREPFVK